MNALEVSSLTWILQKLSKLQINVNDLREKVANLRKSLFFNDLRHGFIFVERLSDRNHWRELD